MNVPVAKLILSDYLRTLLGCGDHLSFLLKRFTPAHLVSSLFINKKSSLFKCGLSSTRLNHRTNSFACLPKHVGGSSEQFKLSVAAFNNQASRRLTQLTGMLDE